MNVGDRVHYVSEGSPVRADGTQKYRSLCRAADITEIEPGSVGDRVGLHVINPTGAHWRPLSDGGADMGRGAGQWHPRENCDN